MNLAAFLRGDPARPNPRRPPPDDVVIWGSPPAAQPVLATWGLDPSWPVVVSFGVGIDSMGVLEGLDELGVVPLCLVFADTGGEHRATYQWLARFERDWLGPRVARGWPAGVSRVRARFGLLPYTLEEHAVRTHRLVSLAYGGNACSLKFKGEEIDRFVNAHVGPRLGPAWGAGRKVVRVIGYDDSPADRERSGNEQKARAKSLTPPEAPTPEAWRAMGPDERAEAERDAKKARARYRKAVEKDARMAWFYPLQVWGWDRRRCVAATLARDPDLGPPPKSACTFCLAGETEIVTRHGIRPIRELAGGRHPLLIPGVGKHGGLGHRGGFHEVEVRSFGVQPLWEVRLRRVAGGKVDVRTVRTTAEHRWFLAADPGAQWKRPETFERTTRGLAPGDRLRSLRATAPAKEARMAPAVAQGFVYGDGSRPSGKRSDAPASVPFYHPGKDAPLLPFFAGCESRAITANGKPAVFVYGLPRFWKDLPPLAESRAFLLSWVAGYFAADGSVSKSGQATMESANRASLAFVRDAMAVCGVGTSPIRERFRVGFPGRAPSAIYRVSLRVSDLPEWFFLIEEHRRRAAGRERQPMESSVWEVESVVPLDVEEEVFCAVVPGAQAFGLADDLMTGNCPAGSPHELVELLLGEPERAWALIVMELLAQPGTPAPAPGRKGSLGLWRQENAGSADGAARPPQMSEYLLEWVPSGRAFATWMDAGVQKAPLAEIAAMPHVGALYRRRGAPPSPEADPAALAALAARARAAGEALRARAAAAGMLGPDGRVPRFGRDPYPVVEAAGVAAWREGRRLYGGGAADVPVKRRNTADKPAHPYDLKLDRLLMEELAAAGRSIAPMSEEGDDEDDEDDEAAACAPAPPGPPLGGGGAPGGRAEALLCGTAPSVDAVDHVLGAALRLDPAALAWAVPQDLDASLPVERRGPAADGAVTLRYRRTSGTAGESRARADTVGALAARGEAMLVEVGGALHAATALRR